jgi:hypothetical protein
LPYRLRRLPAMERTIETMSTGRCVSVMRMRRSLCRHVRARCQAQRQRPRRRSAERRCMGWQRVSGYNWLALVEADIGLHQRVISAALRSRTKSHAGAWPAGVRSPHMKVGAEG